MSSFDYLDFEGICGDRKFMDAYYYYQKSNQELQLIDIENRKQNDELLCCKAYLIAIQQCLFKMNTFLPEGSIKQNYLDWFRWNYIVISSELDRFKSNEHLKELLSDIRNLQTETETTFKRYFELNEEEKAVFNQYVHAYKRVKRFRHRSGPVYLRSLQHTARLFANYISYLIKRFMFDQITSFQDLQSEAEFLIIELRGLDDELSSNVKNIMKQFKQCRDLDKTAVFGQDEIMQEAMLSAHLRATESWLESSLRKIRETIVAIKKRASEKIKECLEIPHLLENSGNNTCYALNHPIEAAKKIWDWVKENPWKSALIIIGGVVIGVGVSSFSIAAGLIIEGVSVLILTVSTLSITGGVLKVREEERKEIELKKQEMSDLKSKNDEEARQIAERIKNEQKLREKLNETRDQFLEGLRLQNLFEEQVRRERENQLKIMNVDELNQNREQLENSVVVFEDKLKDTKEQLQKLREENVKIQKDISLVHEGRAAAARLAQKFAQRCQQKPSENQQKNEKSTSHNIKSQEEEEEDNDDDDGDDDDGDDDDGDDDDGDDDDGDDDDGDDDDDDDEK